MKAMRWLTLISGILLLILGFVMIGTPVENLVSIAVYICLMVLISGVMQILSYFSYDKQFRSGWLLVIGILGTLLGGWMLFSGNFLALIPVLPFVFATWLIVSSISLAVGSIDLKNIGAKNWGWQLAFGILGAILGFSLLLDPVSSALTVSYSLAFAFIYRGAIDVIFFFTTRSLNEKVDSFKKKIKRD